MEAPSLELKEMFLLGNLAKGGPQKHILLQPYKAPDIVGSGSHDIIIQCDYKV